MTSQYIHPQIERNASRIKSNAARELNDEYAYARNRFFRNRFHFSTRRRTPQEIVVMKREYFDMSGKGMSLSLPTYYTNTRLDSSDVGRIRRMNNHPLSSTSDGEKPGGTTETEVMDGVRLRVKSCLIQVGNGLAHTRNQDVTLERETVGEAYVGDFRWTI